MPTPLRSCSRLANPAKIPATSRCDLADVGHARFLTRCKGARWRTGREALPPQANASWRDIPVVVVTALDLTAEDHRRLNGGVEQILSKSAYAPAELIKRVGALLVEAKRKIK